MTNDFTLFSISIISVDEDEGQQHAVNGRLLSFTETESIPWGELVGRRITSVSSTDGRLVLGLSTK